VTIATQVKICGVSTPDTLDAAVRLGASHLGLNHFPKSPRFVDLDRMAALRARVPGHVQVALLLVNPQHDLLARAIAEVRPDIVQLHGDEPPQALAGWRARFPGLVWWKAAPVRTRADIDAARQWHGVADRLLFDAKPPAGAELPGGNGLRFDWALLRGYPHAMDWALSGGLDADNVAEAIRVTGAPLVDVSSGVESAPGIKDVDRMAAFLKAAANA
jgi:phosphoribosylanthranilate isomerase